MKQKIILPIIFLMLFFSFFVSATTYPSPFIVNNNSVDVAIIYGTAPGMSVLEIVQAGNLQSDLQTKSSVEIVEVLVKDYQISAVSDHNLIILGTIGDGCSNSAFEEILGKSCSNILGDSGIGPEQFLIQSVSNPFSPEKIALLIEGYKTVDLVDAVTYLRNNPFETSVGSKYVSPSNYVSPPDSDETCIEEWDCGSWSDCIDNKETRVCDDRNNCGTTNNKPIISKNCEQSLSDIVGKVQLIYDDDLITSLDLIILGNLQTWLYGKEIENVEIMKNSEVNNNDLENKISVFVYNREAVVIYGANLSSSLQLVWAGNIQTYLYEVQGKTLISVCPNLVKSSSIVSDDLKEYFCKEILNPSEDNLIDIPNEETFICTGCKLEDKCYPLGYRKDKKYCSDELEFTDQKIAEADCENNFECNSNLCLNNECVSSSLWAKFIRWLNKIFG